MQALVTDGVKPATAQKRNNTGNPISAVRKRRFREIVRSMVKRIATWRPDTAINQRIYIYVTNGKDRLILPKYHRTEILMYRSSKSLEASKIKAFKLFLLIPAKYKFPSLYLTHSFLPSLILSIFLLE